MPTNELVPPHYASSYQHWDLCIKIPLGYLEGCTTKYVVRWRKKHGMEDLQKGVHYLDKLIEVFDVHRIKRLPFTEAVHEVDLFTQQNHLSILEHDYLMVLCTYESKPDLEFAKRILLRIFDRAPQEIRKIEGIELNVPGTPDDGGQHSRF